MIKLTMNHINYEDDLSNRLKQKNQIKLTNLQKI